MGKFWMPGRGDRTVAGVSGEHFPKDGEGLDTDGGFRMVFQVAEEVFAKGVAVFAAEGKEH